MEKCGTQCVGEKEAVLQPYLSVMEEQEAVLQPHLLVMEECDALVEGWGVARLQGRVPLEMLN